jgi:hypothetical protein
MRLGVSHLWELKVMFDNLQATDHHVNLSDNLEFNLSVQVSPSEPIESIMRPLKAAKPLLGTLHLKWLCASFGIKLCLL